MAKVGIVMGSDSDMPIMAKAADVLKELGIDFDMTIISAPQRARRIFRLRKRCRRKRLQSNYRWSWKGSTSSRNVCRNLPNASYWYSNEDI